jgi:hypothetical protein
MMNSSVAIFILDDFQSDHALHASMQCLEDIAHSTNTDSAEQDVVSKDKLLRTPLSHSPHLILRQPAIGSEVVKQSISGGCSGLLLQLMAGQFKLVIVQQTGPQQRTCGLFERD